MARPKIAPRTNETWSRRLRTICRRADGCQLFFHVRARRRHIGGCRGGGARGRCNLRKLLLVLRRGSCHAIHTGENRSVRGKRVRVRVTADERQIAGCSHHELGRAMTALAEPMSEGLLCAQLGGATMRSSGGEGGGGVNMATCVLLLGSCCEDCRSCKSCKSSIEDSRLEVVGRLDPKGCGGEARDRGDPHAPLCISTRRHPLLTDGYV